MNKIHLFLVFNPDGIAVLTTSDKLRPQRKKACLIYARDSRLGILSHIYFKIYFILFGNSTRLICDRFFNFVYLEAALLV